MRLGICSAIPCVLCHNLHGVETLPHVLMFQQAHCYVSAVNADAKPYFQCAALLCFCVAAGSFMGLMLTARDKTNGSTLSDAAVSWLLGVLLNMLRVRYIHQQRTVLVRLQVGKHYSWWSGYSYWWR
jgi:hypothetical protein